LDLIGGVLRNDVCPDSENRPVGRLKRSGHTAIAFDVLIQLRLPVLGVGLWFRAVDRASVPEATIDVNGQASAAEDEIRPSADTGEGNWVVDAKSHAAAMQLRAQGKLGRGVAPAVATHDAHSGFARWL